jgi:hypothetical protein
MCRFYGLSRDALCEMAYDLAERNNIDHCFNKETKRAGKDWLRFFMKRHPHLSLRSTEPVSQARVQGFNNDAVNVFFNNLEKLVSENGLQPSQIYNMDETGATITPVH